MIYKIMVCLSLLVSISSAFRPVASSIKVLPFRLLKMASGSIQTSVVQLANIEVTCKGLPMTDAIQEKIEKKIDAQVKKLGENQVMSTHITLSLEPRSQIVDVRCNMKGGAVVEARVGSESMYTSLDLVGKTLTENLKKHSAKVKDKHREEGKLGGRITEDEADIINEV
jgi:ribosomal subunit interface protein